MPLWRCRPALRGGPGSPLAGALAVGGGDAGLVRTGREAFTASMSTTFTISAIGVLAVAVVAVLVVRDRAAEPAGVGGGEPEPAA